MATRRKRLKLYVWDGVLCDWTCGVAFALASSPEEAKKQLLEQIDESHWDGLKLDGEPYTEYDEPFGGFCYGGG